MNTFSFYGHVVPVKDTEKFKAVTVKKFDSGWTNMRVCFKVVAGDNEHFVEVNGGKWVDDKKNSVKTMSRKTENEPSKPITIDWEDRFDSEVVDGVARWKVNVIDTDVYSVRNQYKEDGNNEAYEKSLANRHRYIASWDFANAVKELLANKDIKDLMFKISGNLTYSYSEKTGKYYNAYEVSNIIRAENDDEPKSSVSVDAYFDNECFEKIGDGCGMLHAFTQFYDGSTKKNWFAPINLVLRSGESDDVKKFDGFYKMFTDFEDGDVKHVTLDCLKVAGTTKREITYDDLDEQTKFNIECGIMTFEDAKHDLGGNVYGDRIDELRIVKLGRSSSEGVRGLESTSYTRSSLREKPHISDSDDLFSDDDIG